MKNWLNERSFHHRDFADLSTLARKKIDKGLTVSLGLPTLNVASTLGPIIDLCQKLRGDYGLIDQIAVIDSRSTDETVAVALAGGVEVYFDQEILPRLETGSGKGEALWKSLSVLTGDIIIWIDTDICNIHPRFIYGLLGPLLADSKIGFVKAFYRRPLVTVAKERRENEGGRVTELCARPLLSMFWPALADFIQPLSGETAGRREIFRSIPFFTDYAVEIGFLVHIMRQYGLPVMAQVDLDERVHSNQPLQKLGLMSFAIMQAVIKLIDEEGRGVGKTPADIYKFFSLIDGEYVSVRERIAVIERPPFVSIDSDLKDRSPEKV